MSGNYGGGVIQRGFLSKKRGGAITGDVTYTGATGDPANIITRLEAELIAIGLGSGGLLGAMAAVADSPILLDGSVTSLDTYGLTDGEFVLVAGQGDPIDNGLYEVQGTGWIRRTGMETGDGFTQEMWVFINNGATYANTGWRITGGGLVDTNPMVWSQFSGAGGTTVPTLAQVTAVGNSAGSRELLDLLDPTTDQSAATRASVAAAIAAAVANYLLLAGGTMTGAIAMGTNKITGLGAPGDDADASTKKYVDDTVGAVPLSDYLLLAGGTMAGDIAMADNHISGIKTATFNGEVNNGDSGATPTINWTAGLKQRITVSEEITGMTFTAPAGPTNLVLKLINGGAHDIAWPAAVKWSDDTEPDWTASGTDIATFYFDGTNYYGVGALNFPA